jgi:predicted DNA-binding transcriptional regulator AlpA
VIARHAPEPLATVPALADLVRDQALVETLPRHVVAALYLDVAKLEAILRSRLLTLSAATATEAVPALSNDRLLTANEAAALLGVTRVWLYRHAHALDFSRRLSRKTLRFSENGLRKYQARHCP